MRPYLHSPRSPAGARGSPGVNSLEIIWFSCDHLFGALPGIAHSCWRDEGLSDGGLPPPPERGQQSSLQLTTLQLHIVVPA
jgi:hypothetical protein